MKKLWSNTEQSKYSNCTVSPSKYFKDQKIHFHHHRHQAHLIQGSNIIINTHDPMQNFGQTQIRFTYKPGRIS